MSPSPSVPAPRSYLRRRLPHVLAALACVAPCVGFLVLGYIASTSHHSEMAVDSARLDLLSIRNAVKLFHARTGRYPSTEEGLKPVVDLHLLERMPLDPWGREYGYALEETGPRVWSLGKDGRSGGDGDDADLFHPLPRVPSN